MTQMTENRNEQYSFKKTILNTQNIINPNLTDRTHICIPLQFFWTIDKTVGVCK